MCGRQSILYGDATGGADAKATMLVGFVGGILPTGISRCWFLMSPSGARPSPWELKGLPQTVPRKALSTGWKAGPSRRLHRKLPSGEASTSSNINNSIINVYGAGDTDRETINTRHTTPKSAAVADSQPRSSPCSVGECTGIELTLFEYGIWLQGNVVSDRWKEDYRRAVCLCMDQRLYLSLAKRKPLSWWKENGVTEGIAKAFCKFIQAFKKAKEEGWALPRSENPIEQRLKDWYVGTI